MFGYNGSVTVSYTHLDVYKRQVHNHPSGARKPSGADDRLTEAVKKAAETLDIRLLDLSLIHI